MPRGMLLLQESCTLADLLVCLTDPGPRRTDAPPGTSDGIGAGVTIFLSAAFAYQVWRGGFWRGCETGCTTTPLTKQSLTGQVVLRMNRMARRR